MRKRHEWCAMAMLRPRPRPPPLHAPSPAWSPRLCMVLCVVRVVAVRAALGLF